MNYDASINDIAKMLNVSVSTVKQLCETGQIHPDAFHVYDKGTMVETWLFSKAAVFKSMKAMKSKK